MHDLRSGAGAPHDREQSSHDGNNGHHLRPHPLDRALQDGVVEIAPRQRAAFDLANRLDLRESLIEVDQHHHAGLRRDTGKGDEADRDGDRQVEAEPPHQPEPADQRERHRGHHDHRLGDGAEVEVEQQEDDQKRHRHHDLQARGRALEIFVLAAPHHVVARRKLDAGLHCALRLCDIAAEVTVTDVDIDIVRQLSIFGPDRIRPARRRHLRDLAERHRSAGRHRHQHFASDGLRIFAEIAGVAHVDGEALPAFHRRGHGLSAQRRCDRVLNVLDHDAVARQRRAVRGHFEIVAADPAFSIGGRGAGHALQDVFDLLGKLVDLDQISADHLDADGGTDSRRQHVDACLDRHGPGVGQARKLQGLVHFRDQAIDRDTRTPCFFRLEVDDGLEHLGRRRIGRSRGATRFAIDRSHFRKRPDDLVLGLHQFARLGDGDAGQCCRHVKQRAFVEVRHEFGAELARRPDGHRQHNQRKQDHQHLGTHHRLDERAIDPDQETVDRILMLRNDPAAHENHHQRGHQRDRQQRSRCHRECLGERQRAEQASFLRFQREDRHERHGDDQQAEEQRRPDLRRRRNQDIDPRTARLGALQVLVRILDHHDCRIDHGADRNRDAAQAHDVGA